MQRHFLLAQRRLDCALDRGRHDGLGIGYDVGRQRLENLLSPLARVHAALPALPRAHGPQILTRPLALTHTTQLQHSPPHAEQRPIKFSDGGATSIICGFLSMLVSLPLSITVSSARPRRR